MVTWAAGPVDYVVVCQARPSLTLQESKKKGVFWVNESSNEHPQFFLDPELCL